MDQMRVNMTLMLPNKFKVDWPFGSGEEATRAPPSGALYARGK